MSEWQSMESAPTDGTPVQVKRVYMGRTIYEGPAVWRQVEFGACFDPISGEQFAEPEKVSGWMYPDVDKRVPHPTHWRPRERKP